MRRTLRTGTATTSPARTAWTVGGTSALTLGVALLFSAACGGVTKTAADTEHPGHGSAGNAPSVAVSAEPLSIEQLAAKIGCAQPAMQIEAKDLREASCPIEDGQYRITTFLSDEDKDNWVAAARDYGGPHLTGPRWVITSTKEELLKSFQTKVGGELLPLIAHDGH
jgi:hypothetical protein